MLLLLACSGLEPSADPRWNRPLPCPTAPTAAPAFEAGAVQFETAEGERRFEAEIARTTAAQSWGLMYRTALPLGAAMVFPSAQPEDALFWMRDTCLALDLVWIDAEGRVIGVQTADAMETRPRGVGGPSLHVVELGAGVAAANGIVPGVRARIRAGR